MGDQIALGTVQWGMAYGIANRSGQPGTPEIERILAHARDAGVHLLDTARAYGEAESAVGALTEADPWWRIVTKLSPDVAAGSADAAQASVEASLRALRRSELDVLLLHRPADRFAAGGAVWARLLELRRAGTIGAIGISAVDPTDAIAALDDPTVEVLQVAASLFDRRLADAGLFERAAARGVEVHVRSVLLQGVAHLEPGELPAGLAGLSAALGAVQAWERDHGLARGAAWLQYARRLPGATLVLGCERVEQLDANLAALSGAPLGDEDAAQLVAVAGRLADELVAPARWPPLTRP